MRKYALLILVVLVGANAYAQSGVPTAQQQIDQAKFLQIQNELEISRMRAQTEAIQAQTERLRLSAERMRIENDEARKTAPDNLLLIMRDTEEKEQAKNAAKKAEDATDDLRDELERASVRTVDSLFLASSLVFPLLFGATIVIRAKKDVSMKYEQKFGVVLMVVAMFLALLAITVSDNWYPKFDVLQNIQLALRIQFFKGDDGYPATYLIDVATKYVLTFLAAVATYGFTSYLAITPAWKKSQTASVTQEPAVES